MPDAHPCESLNSKCSKAAADSWRLLASWSWNLADLTQPAAGLQVRLEHMCSARAVLPKTWLSTQHSVMSVLTANTYCDVLQVRLEHMLQRLRCLQDAAATAAPTQLLPHLWLSGAVLSIHMC